MWAIYFFSFVAVIGLICGVHFGSRVLSGFFDCGVLEGTLFIDGKAAPKGVWVACSVVRCVGGPEEGFETFERRGQTGAGGRFRFSYLPAGEVGVGRLFRLNGEDLCEVDRRVEVRAGETTTVTLAAGAGRVTGKLSLPDGWAEVVALEEGPEVWLECLGPAPGASESDRVVEYSGTWRRAGGASGQYRDDDGRWRFVPLAGDLSFDVSGLHPGLYGLKVGVSGLAGCDDSERSGLITGPSAFGIRTVVVPPSRDGAVVHVDLGTVLVPASVLDGHGTGSLRGVLRVDGVPAPAGTAVACQVLGEVRDFYEDEALNTISFYYRASAETVTEPGGAFLFEALPAGSTLVSWRGAGEGEEREVEVRPGEIGEVLFG